MPRAFPLLYRFSRMVDLLRGQERLPDGQHTAGPFGVRASGRIGEYFAAPAHLCL